MTDGANLGVTAHRALESILAGKPSPTEDEQTTREETLARVLAAPLPGEGDGPHQRGLDTGVAYSMVTDSICRAMLECEQADPGLLGRRAVFPDDYDIEELRGTPLSPETLAWQAIMARYPDADEWWGGATGFMVGFAYNTARFIMGLPPAGNPAIMEVEVPDE
jgi:hypothetical protein